MGPEQQADVGRIAAVRPRDDDARVQAPAPNRVASGALAGVVATLAFTLVHQVLISDIWATAVVMSVAGAVCGALLAWSYGSVAGPGPRLGWLGYVATYLGLFGLLAILSLVLLEPVMTLGEALAMTGPPDELFGRALPLSSAFVVGGSLVVAALHRAPPSSWPSVLVTVLVLILVLGLNVSVIGLVELEVDGLYLVGELLGLIAVLGLAYALAFLVLEWRSLGRTRLLQRG